MTYEITFKGLSYSLDESTLIQKLNNASSDTSLQKPDVANLIAPLQADFTLSEQILTQLRPQIFKTKKQSLIKLFNSAIAHLHLKAEGAGKLLFPEKSEQTESVAASLERFAIQQGGGYKYANLKILEKEAERITEHLSYCKLVVPPFLSVSDSQIRVHFEEHLSKVFPLWSQFLKTFHADDLLEFKGASSDQEAGNLNIEISEKGKSLLKQIQNLITEHFNQHCFFNSEIQNWLNTSSFKFLIVRSTGKEDSETNSNAGGNDSCPFVLPEKSAISSAIGKVIASYFGEKSISQRLFSGDRSLFLEEKPFTPVLLQEMITEEAFSEEVFRSGVLFTSEEGKAEGVTFIQAGLGSNEGVVNSLVKADSYFVKGENVYSVIKKKNSRFGRLPEKGLKTGLIKNKDKTLKSSEALSKEVLLDLKKAADEISKHYGSLSGSMKPMEIEFTVNMGKGPLLPPTIYLLQARPLLPLSKSPLETASFLDLTVLEKEPIQAEIVLDGGAFVKKVEKPSAILFEENLKNALKSISREGPFLPQVIITYSFVLPTSHEAVLLRPKGIAVITVQDKKEFRILKEKAQKICPEAPLLVDTQKGAFVFLKKGENPEALIKRGFASYPVPLQLTVKDDKLPPLTAEEIISHFNKEIEPLIQSFQSKKELVIPTDKNGLKELLETMCFSEKDVAKAALATTLKALKELLTQPLLQGEEDEKAFFKISQVFEAIMDLTKSALIPALENHLPASLERLFPLKFLEALIFQNPSREVVGATSVFQVLSEFTAQKSALKIAKEEGIILQKEGKDFILSLLCLQKLAYSEDVAKLWKLFVKNLSAYPLEKREDVQKSLSPTFKRLKKVNMLSLWMNTLFRKEWEKAPLKEDKIGTLVLNLEIAEKSNSPTLEWIASRLSGLKKLESSISCWSDPEFVDKNRKSLLKKFKTKFGFCTNRDKFSIKRVFDTSSHFGKIALLQYMRFAVLTFDTLIKEVKGSLAFNSEKEKAIAFGKLLKGYLGMLETLFQLIPNTYEQKEIMQPGMGETILFPEYIEKLSHGTKYNFGDREVYGSIGLLNLIDYLKSGSFTQTFSFEEFGGFNPLGESQGKEDFSLMHPHGKPNFSKQFEAREGFNANALVIGSKSDLNFTVHWPNNLEEYFTALHQNMEQVIKYLNTKHGLTLEILSQDVKEICGIFGHAIEQEKISSLEFKEGKILVGYQIPVQQHSASFEISYNPMKPKKGIDIAVECFGNDEHYRWDQTACAAAILAFYKGCGFSQGLSPEINYENPRGIKFSLHFPPSLPYENKETILKAVAYTVKEITMFNLGDPKDFIKSFEEGAKKGSLYGDMMDCIGQMDWEEDASETERGLEGLGKINWKEIPEECFQHTLWLNGYLINNVLSDNIKLASMVAKNSLLGIVKYKLQDYDREDGSSLKEIAISSIQKAFTFKNSIIQELKEEPDILKYMPDAVEKL